MNEIAVHAGVAATEAEARQVHGAERTKRPVEVGPGREAEPDLQS